MTRHLRTISWQGWHLQMPRRWDPVKLEGDFSQGHALFADTLRPRLGLRWQTPRGRKFNSEKSVKTALIGEVGQLAADEAKSFALCDPAWQDSLLYTEPQPPGRDLFSAFSATSGRLLQVAYHAHRRENLFASTILPTLMDLPLECAALWSIFDLNCIVPGGMKLKKHVLNAGDLSLTFADRYQEFTIRQIAVAQLALQRQSLDAWITDQQKISRRYHVARGKTTDLKVQLHDKESAGRLAHMQRRLRYALMWTQPRQITTLGVHDADRDRLLLLHGPDQSLLQVIAESVGAL